MNLCERGRKRGWSASTTTTQRIDLLFCVSSCLLLQHHDDDDCVMLHLINANTIVVMLVKFACVNSFIIITFALRPDGYGQMQHPSDDVVTELNFLPLPLSLSSSHLMNIIYLHMSLHLFICASLTMTFDTQRKLSIKVTGLFSVRYSARHLEAGSEQNVLHADKQLLID